MDGFYLQDELRAMSYEELVALLPFPLEEFKTKPWRHQLASFLGFLSQDGFMGALEMGLGKSKVVLDVCDFLRRRGHIQRTLVVVFSPSVNNFGRQIEEHSDASYTILRGTYDKRLRLSEEQDTDYHIINYQGLGVMGTQLKDVNQGRNRKRRLSAKRISRFASRYQALVLDDSHEVRNYKAVQSRVAYELACYMAFRFCATGTPYGETLLDLFSQMLVMDLGEAFGTSGYWFEQRYFYDYGPYEKRIRPSMESKLLAAFHARSIRFEESECYDMPETIFTELEYDLGSEQRRRYMALMRDEPFEEDGAAIAPSTRWGKFRQIASGGLLKEGKLDVDFWAEFNERPKLDLAMSVIRQAVSTTKVIVFHKFTFEGRQLEQALKEIGLKYASMRGEIPDNDAEYLRFQADPDVRVMIAHPKSGGAAFEFVNCAVCIFYNSPEDIITRKQCEKRINRKTQQSNRVWYYDLIGRQTIERAVLVSIKAGKDFHIRTLTRPKFENIVMGGVA